MSPGVVRAQLSGACFPRVSGDEPRFESWRESMLRVFPAHAGMKLITKEIVG